MNAYLDNFVLSTSIDEVERLVSVKLSPKAYQVIHYVLNYNGWKPYYPLSVIELWFCVWVTCNKARHADLDQLNNLIEQGYFVVPGEVKRLHNALRYIHNLYEENH